MKKIIKNEKVKSYVLIIVAIAILLGLFLISNFILNKRQLNNKFDIENEEIIKSNNYIEDALNIHKKGKYTGYCSLGLTHFLDVNVKYPRVKLNKENAHKLNDKILNDNKKIIDFIKTDNIDVFDNKNDTTLFIKTSYNYFIKDDIMFIALNSNYIFSDNNNYYKLYNYYYDIKDDKIIRFEDAIKVTDFNLDHFKKLDKNNTINTLDDCKNNLCGFKIKDNKLIPYVNEIN